MTTESQIQSVLPNSALEKGLEKHMRRDGFEGEDKLLVIIKTVIIGDFLLEVTILAVEVIEMTSRKT